ncbi:hypothetical protein ACQJBY_067553 [Aegilops geniculata]
MADLVVGLSKTVVQGALTKVQSAIEEDAKLRKKAQRDLVSISLEFEMMQSFLDVAKEESITNNMVRTWVKHVGELAYDVEDCVEFVVHLDNTPEWWRRLLPSCIAPPLPLDQAVQELEELKRRVEDVNNCYRRYSNINDAGSSSKPLMMLQQPASSTTIVDPAAANMIAEAKDAARRRRGLCDLTKLVVNEGGDSKLQVIAMWGTGGDMEMTASVIWKAYNEQEIYSTFPCRAWVKLTHPFNCREFIKSLINAASYASTRQESPYSVITKMDIDQERRLCNFVRMVEEKRYLIVLEDVSSLAEWGAIRTYFPDKQNGSCIIVSMKQFVVASLCIGHPYQLLELEQFSADHSVYGFTKKGSRRDRDYDEGVIDIYKAAEEWMAEHPLVGRESEMNDLRQYILQARFHEIQVMSVWGMVGAGKSALVKILFCKLLEKSQLFDKYGWVDVSPRSQLFDKYGWVDVSHPFDLRHFCRSLFFSFYPKSIDGINEIAALDDMMGRKNPILECQSILRQNSCLVVIDGLKSTKEWDLIQAELVAGSSRNCIIIITNDASIATYCCGDRGELVFNVKGLQADAAFKLFEEKVSIPSSLSAGDVAELQELISKCGGLPKVIAEIASSLGAKQVGRMYSARALSNNFMHALKTNPEFHTLQGLFGWIQTYFRTCPDSLKPCIQYLPIFPQGNIIRRRRLIRRWIAEGYSRDNHEESAEENGEKHFSNLLDLSIIQQPAEEIASTALGHTRAVVCHVNGFIREYIASQGMEENFVFELGRNCALTTQRTGRHLVILEDWDRDRIVFKSTNFSRLRSLTVFGEWKSFFISESMKILRVLDLEDARGMQDADLEKMVKLLPRLKFLSLRGCREICHLPSSLGDLRQLQTLDVRGTSIVSLPENITKLQKLQYIRAGSGTKEKTFDLAAPASASACLLPKFYKCRQPVGVVMPEGIGKMTVLHTLGVVNVAASGGRAVLKELKKLTQLRKLGVSGINKNNKNEFISAIKGHVHLESLSVQLSKDNQVCLDDIPMPVENLRSLKLYGLNDKLPKWRDQLSKLAKLNLEMAALTEDGIEFLGRLPQLCIFRVKQVQDGELHFRATVNGLEAVTYQDVKVLEIGCGCSSSSLHVTFGSRTMKKLELLKVDCCGGSPTYQFSGLENLGGLRQVLLLNGSNAHELKGRLERQLDEHPNSVKLGVE